MRKKHTPMLVGILLAAVFLQVFFAAQTFSPSSDEVTHLPSGYSYWKTRSIQLNPQHPPLMKLLAAFPLLFMNIKMPQLAGDINEWNFGQELLVTNGIDRLLWWGRLAPMFAAVLLGWFVFRWARELFGDTAGITALFLYGFMPTVLGHAQFVTTDVGVAAFSFMALYYLRKFLREEKPSQGLAAGLALGAALGTKFSAVILLPIFLFLISLRIYQTKRSGRLGRGNFAKEAGIVFGKTFLIFVPAILVVYTVYFFPSDPLFYIKGLQAIYADRSPTYYYYLNGEFSQRGWWYYFIIAFVLKTPIIALVVFCISFIVINRLPATWNDKGFLLLPIVIFFVITSATANNIGLRYIIPVYPFLIVFASGLVPWVSGLPLWHRRKRFLSGVLLMGALWYSGGTLSIFPDYLAYFNELVGGPVNGYQYLDDSNIEWGQDLKRLRMYQERYPDTRVVYYPWKFMQPEAYGIRNILPNFEVNWWSKPSGRYAISTMFLVSAKFRAQILGDSTFDWAKLYKPVDRIGYAFFIYKF